MVEQFFKDHLIGAKIPLLDAIIGHTNNRITISWLKLHRQWGNFSHFCVKKKHSHVFFQILKCTFQLHAATLTTIMSITD